MKSLIESVINYFNTTQIDQDMHDQSEIDSCGCA